MRPPPREEGRIIIQVLHELAKDDGYVALKWAAEHREGRRHREKNQRPALQEKTTDDDDDDDVILPPNQQCQSFEGSTLVINGERKKKQLTQVHLQNGC